MLNVLRAIKQVVEDIHGAGGQGKSHCSQHDPESHARLPPGMSEQQTHKNEAALDPLARTKQAPIFNYLFHYFPTDANPSRRERSDTKRFSGSTIVLIDCHLRSCGYIFLNVAARSRASFARYTRPPNSITISSRR